MAERAEVRGCEIRLDLHYNVDMAGPLLHAKPKKVGVVRAKGRPVATVESSKWVGPIKTPISGEIIEVNEAVIKDATVINRSPYSDGWIVRMKPSNLDAELQEMLTGKDALEAYRAKIESEDLKACKEVKESEA